MSEFTRTLSGINNQFLFFNVDYVVYNEGGSKSFSKQEVFDGGYNDDTEDIHFWRNIFLKIKPKNTFKFKSVGSKSTLIEIADDIINGNLSTVYLAMDSEFDHVLGKTIENEKILYTYGYSYENDVWNENVIISLLEDISAAEVNTDILTDGMKAFFENITMAVRFDGYLFSKSAAFFPRKGGILSFVDMSKGHFPKINQEKIKELIDAKALNSKTVNNFAYRKKIKTQRFCYGHLLADYSCQVITYYLNKYHGLKGLQKDVLYRMCIAKYFKYHFTGSELEKYYLEQFN